MAERGAIGRGGAQNVGKGRLVTTWFPDDEREPIKVVDGRRITDDHVSRPRRANRHGLCSPAVRCCCTAHIRPPPPRNRTAAPMHWPSPATVALHVSDAARDGGNAQAVAVVYDNPLDNVPDLAHIFFKRCLAARVVP